MNNDNELILLNFIFLLESLEAYIEKTGNFPNFVRQLRNVTIPKEVEKRSTLNNCEELFKLKLMLFLGVLGNDVSDATRKELKTKFYQWIDTSKVNVDNWPDEKLKHFFLEVMDVIEKNSEKIFHEIKANLYRKKKEKLFKPEEVSKIFEKVGNIMSNPPQLPSPDIVKGNADSGKETFKKIADSVSASDHQNFHFYPPLTDEEKTEMEQKEQEENQSDPILEGLKINAIAEIQAVLSQRPPIIAGELSNENQNWEEKINEGKKIIEIENIKRKVLANIQMVREKKQQSEAIPSTKSYKLYIILGVVGVALIGLVVWLETRKKKKSIK